MSPKRGQWKWKDLKKNKKEKEKRNGRNDVVFGQEEGQSLGLHVV